MAASTELTAFNTYVDYRLHCDLPGNRQWIDLHQRRRGWDWVPVEPGVCLNA